MTPIRLVLSTIGSAEEARDLADRLVNESLAACVSILPNLTSVYKWKGQVEREAEVLLIFKTHRQQLDSFKARLLELHPYEVPEVVVLDVQDGHGSYLDWVTEMTIGNRGGE